MWQTCVCVHVGADTQARSTTTMQILDMYHVPLRCSVRYYMENLHAVNSVKKAVAQLTFFDIHKAYFLNEGNH